MLHPPYGELTKCSLIWKRFGQRLPSRADPHEEEQTRDAVVWHPCNYISSPSSAAMYPYSSQRVTERLTPQTLARMPGFEWCRRCCRLCGLRLVFIVWLGEKSALRFPLLISSGTAAQVSFSSAQRCLWGGLKAGRRAELQAVRVHPRYASLKIKDEVVSLRPITNTPLSMFLPAL